MYKGKSILGKERYVLDKDEMITVIRLVNHAKFSVIIGDAISKVVEGHYDIEDKENYVLRNSLEWLRINKESTEEDLCKWYASLEKSIE